MLSFVNKCQYKTTLNSVKINQIFNNNSNENNNEGFKNGRIIIRSDEKELDHHCCNVILKFSIPPPTLFCPDAVGTRYRSQTFCTATLRTCGSSDAETGKYGQIWSDRVRQSDLGYSDSDYGFPQQPHLFVPPTPLGG